MVGRKPDFLIIGTMKCGTTSLHNYLGRHPSVFTTVPKEIHFFNNDSFDESKLDEYYAHFISEAKAVGASPQNYTKQHLDKFDGAAERLVRHCPKVKLIYLIRNPIDRIESHFNEAQVQGYSPSKGLNDYIENETEANHYIQTSKYFYQISKFLELFPKDQVKIVFTESLRANRLETLNSIFKFLGVDELQDASLFDFISNDSSHKFRNTRIVKWSNTPSGRLLKSLLPKSLLESLKGRISTREFVPSMGPREKLTEVNRALILKILEEDLAQLSTLTGSDLSQWESMYPHSEDASLSSTIL